MTDKAVLSDAKIPSDVLNGFEHILCIDEEIDDARDHRLVEDRGVSDLEQDSFNGKALAHRAAPDDIAYVIYTSGSTGVPKGVVARHRNAVNTILGINDIFGIGEGDSVLSFSSFCFDLSVSESTGWIHRVGCPGQETSRDRPIAFVAFYRHCVLLSRLLDVG